MKRYEMIKELYDSCHGKSNSYVEEIETEDLDEYMKKSVSYTHLTLPTNREV